MIHLIQKKRAELQRLNQKNMSMAIILGLVFLLLLKPFAGQDECNPIRCGSEHGPTIRFPFRLKYHQPQHCGYPNSTFDLSCSQSNGSLLLELPNSVKVHVTDIDYKSQLIHIKDPGGCLLRLFRNLNLSATPFQFSSPYNSEYSLFSCPTEKGINGCFFAPCLSSPGHQVCAISPYDSILGAPIMSCRKMYDTPGIPYDIVNNQTSDVKLSWPKEICRKCESKGKFCRLKNNRRSGHQSETECFGYLNPPKKGEFKRRLVTAGVVVGCVLLAVLFIAVYYVHRLKRIKREDQSKIERFLEDYMALKPSRYSYADVKKITNQFADKVGQGAYGTVYRGKLSNEVHVAVKTLNNSKGNGEEFINEVGIIGRIHRINVVRLVGFCADGFRRALIYEFLPNDSLEKYISSDQEKRLLGWKKLQDIALGIAKGIEYLHQGCDQRILHFDIKPHNILLDHNLDPKISDFGQAKLCAKDLSVVSMTTVRGTIGYIAPEVFSRNFGNVSYKSDIYSFGMLLLEMIGGKRKFDAATQNISQVYFPEWIYKRLDSDEELGIQVKDDGDAKIVRKLAIVGLWCIQWYPVDRPSMNVVVQMLEGDGGTLIMPANPFTSTNPTAATRGATGGRPLNSNLEVIVESDQ